MFEKLEKAIEDFCIDSTFSIFHERAITEALAAMETAKQEGIINDFNFWCIDTPDMSGGTVVVVWVVDSTLDNYTFEFRRDKNV